MAAWILIVSAFVREVSNEATKLDKMGHGVR